MGSRHAVPIDVFFMWHDNTDRIHDHNIEYVKFNPREKCCEPLKYKRSETRKLAKDVGPDLTAPGGNVI